MNSQQPDSGRVLSALTVVVLTGTPLAIAPGVSFYYDITPKALLAVFGAAAAVLLIGGYARGIKVLWRDRLGRLFLGLLLAQFASLLLATLFSEQPMLSITGSNWRRFGLASHGALLAFTAVFSGWLAADHSRLLVVLRAVTLAGAAAAMYGALQYFGIDPLLPSEAYHIGERQWAIVRPPGTLGHAGYFATYLLYVVFQALALGSTDTSRGWRSLGFATAALAALTVVLSGTRSAILGLLLGALLAAFWYGAALGRKLVAGLAALTLGILLLYYLPAGQPLRSRVRWSMEDAQGGSRLWLWRDSLRMATSHWVTGAGLETFSAVYPRFQSVELARAYPNRYHESPHNVFLDALTSQGAPGLLILVLLLCTGAAAALRVSVARRRARHTGEARRARSGSAAPLGSGVRQRDAMGWIACSLAAGLGSQQFLVFIVPAALYFYATLAMLVVMATPEVRETEPARAARWAWIACGALSAGLVFYGVRLGLADRELVRVRRLVGAGQIPEAIRAYQGFNRVKPPGMSVDLWFSRVMAPWANNAGDAPSRALAQVVSLEAARRAAQEAEDRQNACYNLALFYGLRDDFPNTEASLRKTISVAPNWYKPHWMLAQVLREAGRIEEALVEAQTAVDLNGGKNPEVTSTWNQLRLNGGG